MGCDIVVLRGVEGGGRLHGGRRLRELLDAVVADVSVPLVAAGGIGTRADVKAYLAAGAAAVRIGTRLLATEESDAHPLYKQAVIDAGADDSVLTDVYSVMWPSDDHPPHRVLKRSVAAAEDLADEVAGEMVVGGTTVKIPKYAVPPPSASATGHVEAMGMYAGVAAAAVHGVERAGDVIAALAPA
jgi:nitronate monooxygenase